MFGSDDELDASVEYLGLYTASAGTLLDFCAAKLALPQTHPDSGHK